MSYEAALTAAGAKILDFRFFGSYQGDWWAKVEYDGKIGFVNGSFGSCSGCDAFEAEIGYRESKCSKHICAQSGFEDCEACKKAKQKYTEDLAEFGRTYLDSIMTKEEALRHMNRYSYESEQTQWLKERK